jgi:O-antigen/teichoic acid export membrane protein
LSKNKNSKSKNALFWDLSGAFVKQFSSFFISILLARLLGPEEFGIIASSMVFISISQVFTDVGFTSGLIQQKDSKQITYSSVFYVNLGISLLASAIIILLAPYAAVFFKEPRIETILLLLAIIPPISAIGKVQVAILSKNIDFKSLTLRDVVATTFGGLLGIIAAFSDLGVYSLVIQQITIVTLSSILLWYSSSWRPKLEFSRIEIKKLFTYSSYIFLDDLIRRIFLNIDKVFIAKAFSPLVLGLYARAESLKSMVDSYSTQSLSKVLFPIFSNLQDDDAGFKTTYLKAFNAISGLMVLLVAPLYFLSEFIIILLLGEEWRSSILLFQILILSAIISPHVSIMAKALLAKGYSKYRFKIGLVQRFFMLLPISVGYFYGIEEFAIAMVFIFYVIFVFFLIIIDIKLNINFWKQLRNSLFPNSIFLCFLVLHYFLKDTISEWVFAISFLFIHLFFIKMIKHESFQFLNQTLFQLLGRLKK